MRILILGGTSEARDLATHLSRDPRFEASISLAGRTRTPKALPLPTRIGGFGGAAGLADYLIAEAIDVLIDATHPFAARISANAVAAVETAAIPLASLSRPPWTPQSGDRWTMVPDAEAASRAIGGEPRRVFLTVGRLELQAFRAAPQHHYIARTIDPAGDVPLPPTIRFIAARPPFDLEAELAIARDHRIDVLVSKNSGGQDTAAKLAAARLLAIPVIMIERPPKPSGVPLASVADAMAWLERRLAR